MKELKPSNDADFEEHTQCCPYCGGSGLVSKNNKAAFLGAYSERLKGLSKHSDDILRRVMIVTGAALVLILFYAEAWFIDFVLGYHQPSLADTKLVTSISSSESLKPQENPAKTAEISWYEKHFCTGIRIARNCRKGPPPYTVGEL